jgi:hypothetical protein
MLTSPCFKHKGNARLNSIELHGQEGLACCCAFEFEVASSQHAIGNTKRETVWFYFRTKRNVSFPLHEAVRQDIALACRNS